MGYVKSTKPEYYKLVQADPASKNLKITKFDQELDATSIYHMTFMETKDGGYYDCSCPASKFDYRHKGIMQSILNANKINSEQYFCFQAPLSNPEKAGTFLDAKEV